MDGINIGNLIKMAQGYLNAEYYDPDIKKLVDKFNKTGLNNNEVNEIISYCAICQSDRNSSDRHVSMKVMKNKIMKAIGRTNFINNGLYAPTTINKKELYAIYKFIMNLPEEVKVNPVKEKKDE